MRLSIGRALPILNASFAPVYNNAAIASVVEPVVHCALPFRNYEDIGTHPQGQPLVHNNSDISLNWNSSPQFRKHHTKAFPTF